MVKASEEGKKTNLRVHLIILDGLGIGALPDASFYNDINPNTLKSLS
ncbi:MAG: phosphopentomutase, partial [Clostridiales bacterium]|nr:phosphopentomutase [Clostridiales bacterium]